MVVQRNTEQTDIHMHTIYVQADGSYSIHVYTMYNWQAGASQPSRTSGMIFLCLARRLHIVHMRMRGYYVKRLHGICTFALLPYVRANQRRDSREREMLALSSIYM